MGFTVSGLWSLEHWNIKYVKLEYSGRVTLLESSHSRVTGNKRMCVGRWGHDTRVKTHYVYVPLHFGP